MDEPLDNMNTSEDLPGNQTTDVHMGNGPSRALERRHKRWRRAELSLMLRSGVRDASRPVIAATKPVKPD